MAIFLIYKIFFDYIFQFIYFSSSQLLLLYHSLNIKALLILEYLRSSELLLLEAAFVIAFIEELLFFYCSLNGSDLWCMYLCNQIILKVSFQPRQKNIYASNIYFKLLAYLALQIHLLVLCTLKCFTHFLNILVTFLKNTFFICL